MKFGYLNCCFCKAICHDAGSCSIDNFICIKCSRNDITVTFFDASLAIISVKLYNRVFEFWVKNSSELENILLVDKLNITKIIYSQPVGLITPKNALSKLKMILTFL